MGKYILRILIVFLLLWSSDTYAQKKRKFKMNPYFKGRYKNITVPKSKMNTICPGYVGGAYPYQGVGIKLGDPFAFTYKAYLSESISIVMDLGRVSSGLYNNFHIDNFAREQQPDTLTGDASIRYFGHTPRKDGVFAVKLLFASEFSDIKALRAYFGAGLQYRWSTIDYTYIREVPTRDNELGSFVLSNTTTGVAGTLGIEYSHPSIPVSSFFEVETYLDLNTYPDWVRVSAGVGLRYTF